MTDESVPSGLPTHRDVLKLLFRNILAQKAVRNSAGNFIAKLAATNKICLDSIARVTNQFRTSTITSHGMTLKGDCGTPAIVVTGAQFMWLVQWGMLHLKHLTIASSNAREWQAIIEYFDIHSLDTLKYVVPLYKPRKLTDNSSLDLAADIVKLNASRIKELDGVPVWNLSVPLPALRLRLFTYTQPYKRPWWYDLDNLYKCVLDELRVDLEHCWFPDDQMSLDALAHVKAKKIVFDGFSTTDFFPATDGIMNEHVRHVHFTSNSVERRDLYFLHCFLPNLTSIRIDADCQHDTHELGRGMPYLPHLHQIAQYLASGPSMPSLTGQVRLIYTPGVPLSWTAENVLDEYGAVQKARDVIARVPPQLQVWARLGAEFYRVGDAKTKEADKLASERGFNSESFVMPYGRRVEYERKIELGPERSLHVHWTVYDQN